MVRVKKRSHNRNWEIEKMRKNNKKKRQQTNKNTTKMRHVGKQARRVNHCKLYIAYSRTWRQKNEFKILFVLLLVTMNRVQMLLCVNWTSMSIRHQLYTSWWCIFRARIAKYLFNEYEILLSFFYRDRHSIRQYTQNQSSRWFCPLSQAKLWICLLCCMFVWLHSNFSIILCVCWWCIEIFSNLLLFLLEYRV